MAGGLESFGIPYDPEAAHQIHWAPGNHGKGILAKDGTLHTWNTMWNRPDGDPNHRRYMMESPAFDYDPYPDPNFRGNLDHMYFWIEPDGAIYKLNRYGDGHDSTKRAIELDPRLYHPEVERNDEWHFGGLDHQRRGMDDEETAKMMESLGFGPLFKQLVSDPQPDSALDERRQQREVDPIGYERMHSWDRDGDVGHHPDIEWVPTHELTKFMEYDRRPGGAHSDGNVERWEALKAHIDQHGFKNPVVLEFNPDTGMAHMGEGNHRTQIARELGIPAMPVRVYRSRRTSPTQIPVSPRPESRWQDRYDPTGYHWPESMKPSHLGLPTVPPPSDPTSRIARLTKLYHVSPRKNRESIERYGLTAQDPSAESYWEKHAPDRVHPGQPRGNYFFENINNARSYLADLAQRHHSPERWVYPGDSTEPLSDHPGFDIWEVDPQGLELGPDPEIWLHRGRPTLLDPDDPLLPDPSDLDLQDAEARWYTPHAVPTHHLQLVEHVPLDQITDTFSDDANAEADHVPYEWTLLHPKHLAPKQVAPEIADAWNL